VRFAFEWGEVHYFEAVSWFWNLPMVYHHLATLKRPQSGLSPVSRPTGAAHAHAIGGAQGLGGPIQKSGG